MRYQGRVCDPVRGRDSSSASVRPCALEDLLSLSPAGRGRLVSCEGRWGRLVPCEGRYHGTVTHRGRTPGKSLPAKFAHSRLRVGVPLCLLVYTRRLINVPDHRGRRRCARLAFTTHSTGVVYRAPRGCGRWRPRRLRAQSTSNPFCVSPSKRWVQV